MSRWIDIHNHLDTSNIRLVDAICTLKGSIARAKEIGLKGIAFTDHECLSKSIEICEARESNPELKLAIGNEIYLTENRNKGQKYYHFILVAKDEIGHRQLRELSSRAWLQGYMDKGMKRVPTLMSELAEVVNKNKGHLIATSACIGGLISSKILELEKARKVEDIKTAATAYQSICHFIEFILDLFGDDFYIELPPGASKEQILVNNKLFQIAKIYNIKCEISCDSHYLKKEDRYLHEAFLKSVDGEREVAAFYEYSYLQDESDIYKNMEASFGGLAKDVYEYCCKTSKEIYDKIEEYDLRHNQTIPKVDVPSYPKDEIKSNLYKKYPNLSNMFISDDKYNRYWVNECFKGFEKKKVDIEAHPEYLDELEKEADIKRTVSERLDTNIFKYPITLKYYIDMMWEMGSTLGAGRGCFTPNNKVIMSDGKVKNIQDVQVGDFVLTAKGNIKKVENVLCYDCNEEIYEIVNQTFTDASIQCTNNHEFWVMEGQPCGVDRVNCSKKCSRQCSKKQNGFPKKWKRADELTTMDFIFYPRPKFSSKNIEKFDLSDYIHCKAYYIITDNEIIGRYGKGKKINRYITVDKDFMYLLGVAIGDGWTVIDKDRGEFGLAFNSENQKDIDSMNRCIKILKSYGLEPAPIKHKTKKLIQLMVYNRVFSAFIEYLISHGVENKQIPKELLYDNKEEMFELFKGLMASDGSYDKTALRISYDGINFNLISQIKMLWGYLGIYGSITTRKASGNNKESYKLRAGGTQLNAFIDKLPLLYQKMSPNQINLIIEEDGFYFRVKEIKKKKYSGKVYDLTVEDDHCYMINQVAVHNSAGAGLNHWLLGITQSNPLRYDLPFERYMNWDTKNLPDIDIDLCASKRPAILQKIKEDRGKNFYKEIDDVSRANLGCTLVATFTTTKPKRAVLMSCKGYRSEDYPNGIDNDAAQYIASLIPSERGFLYSIKDCVYGNEEKGRKPQTTFIKEVNKYPGLLDIILGISGLIVGCSSHASGVIFFDEDPYEHCCFMTTPRGDVITQYDLESCESGGLTKYDYLITSLQDKIMLTLLLLQEYGQIDKTLTLRQAYEKYLDPETIDYNIKEVWDNINSGNILCLFQFDSDVGSQGIKLVQPQTLVDLSNTNGIIRLMAEDGKERPLNKFVRYKNDISLWYKEMADNGLTLKEQKVLEKYMLKSYGLAISQECIMWSLMDKDICGFTLAESNKARKTISKKRMSELPALREKILSKATSPAMGEYVWNYIIMPSAGYGFSDIHSMSYSMIGYQTAYLATMWDSIYWNTACLIVNSDGIENDDDDEVLINADDFELENGLPEEVENDEDTEIRREKAVDYSKLAKAINKVIAQGIKVSPIDINKSGFTFKPNPEKHEILMGLRGIARIGTPLIKDIMEKRPFKSFKDFLNRCPMKKDSIISLIKAGAFDNVESSNGRYKNIDIRYLIMNYYLGITSKPKKRITLQNLNGLIDARLLPQEYDVEKKIYKINKVLKKFVQNNYYIIPAEYIDFLIGLNLNINYQEGLATINQDEWNLLYKMSTEKVKKWIEQNRDEILETYNLTLLQDEWKKYAKDNISAWEIAAMCFYYHPHELQKIDVKKYGISDFEKLPEIPAVDYTMKRGLHEIPIYKLHRIIGTVIAKNNTKFSVDILTTTGVVTVKFTKDYYAMFNRRIKEKQDSGKSKIMEESWFKRGEKIMVTGYRRDDTFVAKTYKNTPTHQLYKITNILNNGTEMVLTNERYEPKE